MLALHQERLSKFTHGDQPLSVNIFNTVLSLDYKEELPEISQFVHIHINVNTKIMQVLWRLLCSHVKNRPWRRSKISFCGLQPITYTASDCSLMQQIQLKA